MEDQILPQLFLILLTNFKVSLKENQQKIAFLEKKYVKMYCTLHMHVHRPRFTCVSFRRVGAFYKGSSNPA